MPMCGPHIQAPISASQAWTLLLQSFSCPGLTSCAIWAVCRQWGLHGPVGCDGACRRCVSFWSRCWRWDRALGHPEQGHVPVVRKLSWIWAPLTALTRFPTIQNRILDTELKANACLKWVPLPVGESPILFLSLWAVGPPPRGGFGFSVLVCVVVWGFF